MPARYFTAAVAAALVSAASPALAQQKMVIKAADVHPLGYPTVEAVVRMGKKLEAATSGRLTVQMYPQMQLGGEPGRLDLYAQAQLHHVEDLVERLQPLGLDAKWRARRFGRDKGAHALPRDDQAFGAQCRHRFAHHRTRDARGSGQRLLGRQPCAGRQAPATNLARQLLEELPRELRFGDERTDAHGGLTMPGRAVV